MPQVFEIPLVAGPQTLSTQLGGVAVRLTLAWNGAARWWALSISDVAGNLMAASLPMVPGLDLLAQHRATIGIPGALVVQCDSDPDDVPAYDDLGGRARLYFVTAD